ncbi:hypothetical protein G5V59_26835 [Nocardioides sp. W3-2-3]|uniref:hypothetical protein n=1 Tax=Nocardioides convexus TaxID=2712224 RepID=UPI00241862A5|nr:hypothetical protein [Nocardioides convexus]NHA02009.1 hypothetical protein [Nocardioides convexus]
MSGHLIGCTKPTNLPASHKARPRRLRRLGRRPHPHRLRRLRRRHGVGRRLPIARCRVSSRTW